MHEEKKREMISRFKQLGVIPVITVKNPNKAERLAHALENGGLPAAEVTFRTPGAAEVIKRMKQACPNMLVGAGTVLTKAQIDEAIDAGAAFIVSPGLNPTNVAYCIEKNIPVLPGVSSAGDIERGLSLGLTALKFFPAEAAGGLPMLKALSAPYNMVKFMPTGGIKPNNLKDYLKHDFILACGGTWVAPEAAIEADDFQKIETLAREAAGIVKEIRG